MDDHERYLFDLRGYIVVKDVLSPAQLVDLRTRLGAHLSAQDKGRKGSDRTRLDDPLQQWSAASLIEWGGSYVDLVDLPRIAPYLEALLGEGYRLDHDYLNVHDAENPGGLFLHGGGQGAGGPTDLVGPTDGGQCYYRCTNGRMFNGLVAVGFELETVPKGAGGFACVPGSHKASFELPADWKRAKTQAQIPACVDRVEACAGDAIIFTEAAAHGTVPWEGEGRRHTAFYKYCPHAVAWAPCYYDAERYEGLSEAQRAGNAGAIWRRAQEDRAELLALRSEMKRMKGAEGAAKL
jgi:hypothetical protein